jgi:hypothetical protein
VVLLYLVGQSTSVAQRRQPKRPVTTKRRRARGDLMLGNGAVGRELVERKFTNLQSQNDLRLFLLTIIPISPVLPCNSSTPFPPAMPQNLPTNSSQQNNYNVQSPMRGLSKYHSWLPPIPSIPTPQTPLANKLHTITFLNILLSDSSAL